MTKVTTFYSYKGGSGRSMTMANVAWAMATNGERVLAIDWDLEAPGLHRYFHPFLEDPEQAVSDGLIDRIWSYIEGLETTAHSDHNRFELADCSDIVQPLDLPMQSKGCLHLLGAGRQDDAYSAKVGGLDWANFYSRFEGGDFIERLIEWARGRYTHIMIDSRTGVADTAGICTAQLPDAVVICLVYNRQSIEGSAAIARSIVKAREERHQSPVGLHFVPCRVEERGVVEAARRYAATRLGDSLEEPRMRIERQLRRDEIRHFPWCAFEEKLAVFEDVPDERGSLLDAMHELAKRLDDRKKLKIQNFDAKLLETIWRRAAFDDPRMADLELLADAPLDDAYSTLLAWVDSAIDDQDERPDWQMALSEAAVSFAGRTDDRHSENMGDFLGDTGLNLAESAWNQDPLEYTVRFAILLQSRAAQLQKLQRYDLAIQHAEHSYHLLLEDGSATSKWRAARSLERLAELSLAKDEPARALAIYREVVDSYSAIGARNLPLGAELDPARSLRLLAEQLMEQGEHLEADRVASKAVKMLGRSKQKSSSRDAAEAVNILATRAEIASMTGADTADREISKVRMYARESISSPKALEQLERRLCIAEAKLQMNRGDYARALRSLEQASEMGFGSDNAHRDLEELRVSILIDMGRSNEAADLTLEMLWDKKTPPSSRTFELLKRSLVESGREEEFNIELTKVLVDSRKHQPAHFNAALEWLLSQRSGPLGSHNHNTEDILRSLSQGWNGAVKGSDQK